MVRLSYVLPPFLHPHPLPDVMALQGRRMESHEVSGRKEEEREVCEKEEKQEE